MLGDGTLDDAIRHFEEKFKDKSGLVWANRTSDPKPDKYAYLERSYEKSSDEDEPEDGNTAEEDKGSCGSLAPPPSSTLEPATTELELIYPNGEDFIVRLAFRRPMARLYPLVLGSANPRRWLPLVDGQMLDELICAAFNCDDTDNTFRGHLRQAVAAVKEDDVLTSLCAWRMGGEADTKETADLTLLVTVRPGSTSQAEAIQMIEKIREVLIG